MRFAAPSPLPPPSPTPADPRRVINASNQRTHNRVQRNQCLVRKEGQGEQHIQRCAVNNAAHRIVATDVRRSATARPRVNRKWNHAGRNRITSVAIVQYRAGGGNTEPSQKQEKKCSRLHQAAAQVIENLPARKERDRIGLRALRLRWARAIRASRQSASRRAASDACDGCKRCSATDSRRSLRRR